MPTTETDGTFSLTAGKNYVHRPFTSKEEFLAHHEAEAAEGDEKSEDIIRTHNILSINERCRQHQQELEDQF